VVGQKQEEEEVDEEGEEERGSFTVIW